MMKISFRQALVGAVLLGATAAGGALAASAIDDGTTSTTPVVRADDSGTVTTIAADDATASDNNNDDGTDQDGADADGDHAARTDETPLTGDALAKATAAAQAAVPGGTVVRAENDADGGVYEVHMTKADGSHVTVQLAADFTVTSIDADHGRPGGPGGPGGHGGHRGGKGGHGNETPLTGDEATKVTAAAETAVPGGTVDRVETDAEGAVYEAHVTKADGSHVTVHFNADYSVADIETGH